MTNTIIEDYDFSQYPIVRTYKLGDKTVIQIGQPIGLLSWKEIEANLDRLQHDHDLLEKERDELSDELESIGDAATVKADKEELQRLEDAFAQIEQAVSGFATSADIRPTTNEADNIDMLHEKYSVLQNEVEDLTEDIRGLRVDNKILADTVFRQEQTIARLEEKLATK